ncbi:hypothetical protein [Halodesulfovibrio aestuarii]|uniref:Uncharacterized protein n=1 Tax=Halodesulfovibrio aestuarii TaxID=126333 RepID=A0ABV4JY10_9BACT
MVRILCSVLCSFLATTICLTGAYGAAQHDLPPPVTKVLTHTWKVSPAWKTSTYTFHKEEFINPRIVEEMQGPLADSGSQLISVNVQNANISNQFFSEVRVRSTTPTPYVYYQEDNKEFGYSFVGATTTGIQIVHTQSTQGGSGVYHNLLFFIFTDTDAISFGLEVVPVTQPTLTLIGTLPLGDRFTGTISLADDTLTVLPPKESAQPLPLYSGGIILQFK